MADSVVIREFLVALGFRVDEKGLKNFREGVEGATKGVVHLISTISGAALTVGAGISAFASKLERLYFVAQRTGAAETSLKSLEFAARNFGVSSEQAIGTVENLARMLRNVPGSEGLLQQMGVQTRDANGNLRDSVDLLTDLGGVLAKMPQYEANAYGGVFGIDENLLLAMRNGDFEKFLKQYREMSKTTGLDKAADDSHKFMTQLRGLGTTFENLGIRVEGAMLQKVGPSLDRFQHWMDEHCDEIAKRIADIASAFVNAAAAMGPPLKWMADKLVELDDATNGWSTRAIALLGVLRLLGGAAVIGGVSSLATAVAAVGAGFAGWKIGDSIRDIVDKFITQKSGGKYRSLWDIITGTDRSGLDKTGGYTQAEIDSVKDDGGAKLTPPRGAAPAASPSSGAPAASGGSNLSAPGFIDRVRAAIAAAKESERKYGVPWLVTFAQWALESGFGSSGLSKRSNNPFSIQATKGQDFVLGLDHRADGTPYQAKFRRFKTLEDAFDAHAQLLAKGRPYANARRHMGDAFSFADALTGVYAEDPQYGAKLKAIMARALGNSEWLAQGPQTSSARATGRGDVSRSVDVKQDVRIEVNGVNDPAAAGREVARNQAQVANNMAREMRGVIA
ncbi:glucosaminidase domain-containing protein [Burkholderia vietnamiensis]|nr:glucosaminidase domain-containing protein [Burkholderia vietnamiensis]